MSPDPAVDAGVRRTLAAYGQACDDGRFEDFGECFAEDAVVRVLGRELVGRASIRAWMTAAQPPERRGTHVTVNTVIDDLGDGRASAVSDFLFVARSDDGFAISSTGRYLDELVEVDGQWLFASREIVLRDGGQ